MERYKGIYVFYLYIICVYMKVKVKLLSCVWLSNRMDCSPPGSSIHGIFQARVLEWIAIYDWSDLAAAAYSLYITKIYKDCLIDKWTKYMNGRIYSQKSILKWPSMLDIINHQGNANETPNKILLFASEHTNVKHTCDNSK